jgi:Calcineurin-like phosphoesterase
MGVIEVVVGDVHARADLLRALLRAVGALDSRGHRRRGFWIVQVGDLLDRRASPEANLAAARLGVEALDVVLAGNHEVEILSESGSVHGAALSALASRGWPQAAYALSGWLVSHAGVHPELTHGLPSRAEECAAEINDRWHRRPGAAVADPLLDWVGPAKGGLAPYGGLFWRADSEWPPEGRTPWGQIHGHVPQVRPRLEPGPRWLIDVGGSGSRLAALVRRGAAAEWSPWLVRLTRGRVARARRATEPTPLAA